jgi:hypothetical protein
LHQAIAMFQRHESEMDAETESWIEYFASGWSKIKYIINVKL